MPRRPSFLSTLARFLSAPPAEPEPGCRGSAGALCTLAGLSADHYPLDDFILDWHWPVMNDPCLNRAACQAARAD